MLINAFIAKKNIMIYVSNVSKIFVMNVDNLISLLKSLKTIHFIFSKTKILKRKEKDIFGL